jgi:TPR repeat protein
VHAADDVEAARWYELAVNNGSAGAALQLAQMYANDKGVAQNAARAQYWSVRAAELAQDDGIECHEGSKGADK